MNFVIPPNAHSVTLLVRRGKAHKEVPALRRTLTQEGADLCVGQAPFWEDVVGSLSSRFGAPQYYAGPMPSMLLTCYIVFTPPEITTHPQLASTASGKNIQGGTWFQAQKDAGLTRIQIIRALWDDPSIWEGQPFEPESRRVHEFIVAGAPTFRVAVSDEPAITLALLDKVEDDQLGLGPTEGLLIFRDQGDDIISGLKLVPTV